MKAPTALPPLVIHAPHTSARRRISHQVFSPKKHRVMRDRCQKVECEAQPMRGLDFTSLRSHIFTVHVPTQTRGTLSQSDVPLALRHRSTSNVHPRPPRTPQEQSNTARGSSAPSCNGRLFCSFLRPSSDAGRRGVSYGRGLLSTASTSSEASPRGSGDAASPRPEVCNRGVLSTGTDSASHTKCAKKMASDCGGVSTGRDSASQDAGHGQGHTKSVRQMTTVELMTNPGGPVLDYSFLRIADIRDLRTVAPRSGYREKPPENIETTDRYGTVLVVDNPLLKEWVPPPAGRLLVTQGLKLSNNELSSLPGVTHIILREVLERSWLLRWIDLSFNNLQDIPEAISSYSRLNTLYLHANRISHASQVKILTNPDLHSLTLHGNPCENGRHYKKVVLAHCAALRRLDFSTVTKHDRELATIFAQRMAAAASSKSKEHALQRAEAGEEDQVVTARLCYAGGPHASVGYALSVAIAQGKERELQYGELRV